MDGYLAFWHNRCTATGAATGFRNRPRQFHEGKNTMAALVARTGVKRADDIFFTVMSVAMLAIGGVLLWRLLRSWLRPRRPTGTAPLEQPAPTYRNGTTHAADGAASSSVDRARVELERFRREG